MGKPRRSAVFALQGGGIVAEVAQSPIMPDVDLPLPFEAYTGDKPFVFASYAHKDGRLVFPELRALHEKGLRIWYDEGIDPGNEWPEEIANALQRASFFIVFISRSAVESRNVRSEINFALNEGKPLLAIHIEDTKLPPGLALRIGDIQAIMKWRMTAEHYARKLASSFPASVFGEAPKPKPTVSRSATAGVPIPQQPAPGESKPIRPVMVEEHPLAVFANYFERNSTYFAPCLVAWLALAIAALAGISGSWYLRGGLAGIYAVALAYPVVLVVVWRGNDPEGWEQRIRLAVRLVLLAPVLCGILWGIYVILRPVEHLWSTVWPEVGQNPNLGISKGILAIVLLVYFFPFADRGERCGKMGLKPKVFDRYGWVLALAPILLPSLASALALDAALALLSVVAVVGWFNYRRHRMARAIAEYSAEYEYSTEYPDEVDGS
jgi:TIR domain